MELAEYESSPAAHYARQLAAAKHAVWVISRSYLRKKVERARTAAIRRAAAQALQPAKGRRRRDKNRRELAAKWRLEDWGKEVAGAGSYKAMFGAYQGSKAAAIASGHPEIVTRARRMLHPRGRRVRNPPRAAVDPLCQGLAPDPVAKPDPDADAYADPPLVFTWSRLLPQAKRFRKRQQVRRARLGACTFGWGGDARGGSAALAVYRKKLATCSERVGGGALYTAVAQQCFPA